MNHNSKETNIDKQTLIDHLNEDLAGDLGAIIQYLIYAAKTTGPYRPQLTQFFLPELSDEQLHAQFLANKIVALDGEPVTQPRAVPVATTNRKMLEAIVSAERQASEDYTQRAKEAEVARCAKSETQERGRKRVVPSSSQFQPYIPLMLFPVSMNGM